MFKKDDLSYEDNVETIIGPSVQVEGDFNAAGDVIVEGVVSGSLKTEKNLKVGQNAKIYANVVAGSAHVSGEIHGNIKVDGSLELTSTAKIYGDIKTDTLAIASGACFHGKCASGEEKKRATSRKNDGKKSEETDEKES